MYKKSEMPLQYKIYHLYIFGILDVLKDKNVQPTCATMVTALKRDLPTYNAFAMKDIMVYSVQTK